MTIGSRVGAYEITGTLGAGGMGEVYRARDTRLQRDVALKILPDAVVDDPERLARFRREAQLLAALNHPNIAQIYGIEQADGAPPAIAMELVPGVTLEELVHGSEARSDARRRGLPPAEVSAIARQIAAALEAAHETGIVHRDLKPANVKIRDDGVVKVLDFGLAKADESRSAAGDVVARAATVTSPAMTAVAQILGTAAYMAPEQARGRAVDKRADVWAFGVVLFELLTGERLFGSGQSVTETLASVLKDEIDLRRLPANTPRALGHLIGRCLERDPQQRLRDIGEARIALSRPLDVAAPVAVDAAGLRSRRVPVLAAVAGAAILAAAAAAVSWTMKPSPPHALRRLDLSVPAGMREAAISNDGTRVAYLADNQIYVRQLDELEPRTLGPVHVSARSLVWSPDDRAIAFAADATVQFVPAAGGSPFVVTSVPASGRIMGMAWLPDDTIVFSVWRDSLYRVPASGGDATVAVSIDTEAEIDFHGVSALSDNRLIVSTHRRREDADIVELVALGDNTRRTVLSRDPDLRLARVVRSGGSDELFFVREVTNPGLWTVPFDGEGAELGRATLLVGGASHYSVARDGTALALIPARERRRFTWVDLRGLETDVPGDDIEGLARDFELSPDGRRVAFVHGDYRTAGVSAGSLIGGVVKVRELRTGADTRVTTSTPSSTWGNIGMPTWSADGERLIHRTGRIEGSSLVELRADIAGAARPLVPGMAGRLLPDGRTLIFTEDHRGAGRLSRLVIGQDGQAGAATPLFPEGSVRNAGDFDLSADGRLIAFVSTEQGERGDVHLAEIDRPSQRFVVQVGGNRPRFTANGRYLYFVRGAVDAGGRPRGELARVSIATSPRLSLGPVEVVLPIGPDGPALTGYDVSPDGQRMLTLKPIPPRPGDARRLVLVERR
jgi:tRNA A-37 threonylcarbamoyl transferase component Bud32